MNQGLSLDVGFRYVGLCRNLLLSHLPVNTVDRSPSLLWSLCSVPTSYSGLGPSIGSASPDIFDCFLLGDNGHGKFIVYNKSTRTYRIIISRALASLTNGLI